MKDKYTEDSVRVRNTLYHLHVQNQFLTMENKGLKQALRQKKNGNKKSRHLPSIQRQDWKADTEWWSPSHVNKAQQLQDDADEAEKAEEIRKADAAKLRETSRLLKQKLEAEKVEKREKEKKERDKGRLQSVQPLTHARQRDYASVTIQSYRPSGAEQDGLMRDRRMPDHQCHVTSHESHESHKSQGLAGNLSMRLMRMGPVS